MWFAGFVLLGTRDRPPAETLELFPSCTRVRVGGERGGRGLVGSGEEREEGKKKGDDESEITLALQHHKQWMLLLTPHEMIRSREAVCASK